jgi:hypothetical protein
MNVRTLSRDFGTFKQAEVIPMNESEILPAPKLELSPNYSKDSNRWSQERETFLRLLPALLSTHRRKYVALCDGVVVDCDDDEIGLALRVYRKQGYVPIYVGFVSDEPPVTVRVPSARLLQNRRNLS